MFNRVFSRLFLVATELIPVLFILMVTRVDLGVYFGGCIIFLLVVFGCGLYLARTYLSSTVLNCERVRPIGCSNMFFVFYSFLVLFGAFGLDWSLIFLIVLYIIGVQGFNYSSANVFFRMMGFRFYEIGVEGSVPFVLITRKDISSDKIKVLVSQVGKFVFFDVER